MALVALLATLAAGCGSDEEDRPIPRAQVTELEKQLRSIENRLAVGDGACRDILEGEDNNVDGVERALRQIPDTVDPDVRDALRESFDRLFTLASEQCDEARGQETTPTQPTPVPTTPQTQPAPPETSPQTSPQPVPTQPEPDEDEGPEQEDGSGGSKPKKPKENGGGGKRGRSGGGAEARR